MSGEETFPSGQIIRHQERKRAFRPAIGDPKTVERIERHIQTHIGDIKWVYHEIISDLIHLDVYVVPPSSRRNYYTLVTGGMSDLPMNVPAGAEAYKYAELMLFLPPTWKLNRESLKNENGAWPLYWLKLLARMPHEYDTWLYTGHTIPNGDPPVPFSEETKLCGMLVAKPALVEDAQRFSTLRIDERKNVHFYSLFPVYKEEMDFKLKHGVNALLRKFEKAGINEMIHLKRKNVCKKFLWFFYR